MAEAPPPSYEEANHQGTAPYPTKDGSAPYPQSHSNAGYQPTQNNAIYPQQTTQPPQGGSTVVITQPTVTRVVHNNPYGFIPVQVTCQYCNQQTVTELEYESNLLAWLGCGALTCMGCILGCCLIPFCIKGLKDVSHKCSHCGKQIGYRRRLS